VERVLREERKEKEEEEEEKEEEGVIDCAGRPWAAAPLGQRRAATRTQGSRGGGCNPS